MSAGTTDADVVIHLKADDEASAPIDSATKQINDSYKQLTNNARAAGREWINNNFSLYELGRTMHSVHTITRDATNAWNTYNLIQIRNEQITQNVITAQEKLAQAYASGDPSRIAQAQKDVAVQLDAQKKAAEQAQAAYLTMAVNMISASGTLFSSVIPKLLGLIQTMREVQIAAGVTAALSTAAGGGVGAGTLAGAGSGVGAALSKGAGIAARAAGPAAVGVALLSMMGQQQAGETSVPTGIDALNQIGGDITKSINNTFNIIVQDAGAAAKQVQNELSKVLSFGGQPAS